MSKQIINQLLLNGKTITSEKIWLKSIKFFSKSFIKNPKKLLNRAVVNITPLINVKQLKRKRKRLQLKEFPYIVSNKNRISVALKFFLNDTKNKNKIKTYKNLIVELALIANNTGKNLNKKKNLYEYAFVKKKYFYYRWF